jgi:hypothetical protein
VRRGSNLLCLNQSKHVCAGAEDEGELVVTDELEAKETLIKSAGALGSVIGTKPTSLAEFSTETLLSGIGGLRNFCSFACAVLIFHKERGEHG